MRDATLLETPTATPAATAATTSTAAGGAFARRAILAYSGFAYLLFQGVFLYLVAFLANLPVPITVNGAGSNSSAEGTSMALALAINLGLIAFFGLQHSGMARRGFKRFLTRFLPEAMERSTYVLVTNVVFLGIFVAWQPMPQMLWQAEHPVLRGGIYGAFALGWAIVFLSTFLLSHFELFGLKQAWNHLRESLPVLPTFRTPAFYRFVRHPLMTGFLIALWATPDLSVSRVVFAGGFTLYILVGTLFEEKDLVRTFGKTYLRYRQKVPAFLPVPGKRLRSPEELAD